MTEFPIDNYIRKVRDFPQPGVLFFDITGVIIAPEAFNWVIDRMCELYAGKGIDAVAGVEARGFLFAAPFACKMGIPLILVRKKGKLPGKTITGSCELEYGVAEIEIRPSDIKPGQNVLLVDDVIATGSTFQTASALIRQAGGISREVFCLVNLTYLHNEERLAGLNVTSLLSA
jgi:adenine phosphoribosyltransferase